jgi:hypothetical protein
MTETNEYVFKNGVAYERPAPRVRITAEEVLDATVRPALADGRPWICAVAGPTADARAAVARALATRIDPEFTPGRIVTSTEEFLGAFRTCPAKGVILFEVPEAPATAPSIAVQLGTLVSMLQYTGIVAVLSLPSLSVLDHGSRRLLNAHLMPVVSDPAAMPAGLQGKVGAYWYEVRNVHRPQPSGERPVKCINLAANGPALPEKNGLLESGARFVNPTVKGVKVRKVWFPAPAEGETGA